MTKKQKFTDELEAAMEHGLDVPGRRVFLHGDVDEASIGKAIRGLYLLADLDDAPIELYITSYGGELDESFAIHDVLRHVKVPVHTVALGKCMSAAPIILAGGKPGERWASENTLFMMHDVSLSEVDGHPSQVANLAKVTAGQMKRMADLLGNYTEKPAKFWSKLFYAKVDQYFTAEQALDYGLIDQIWTARE